MKKLCVALLSFTLFQPAFGQVIIGGGGGGGGSGTVTSIATGCQATGGTITTTGTISTQLVESPNAATIAMNSYTLIASDLCTNVTLPSGYTGGLTIPTTATAGFGNGAYVTSINNQSGATQTISIGTNNIDGLTSFILPNGMSFGFHSDGTNYHFVHGGQNFYAAQRHAVIDAAYSMVSGDRVIAYTSITTGHIVTLVAANTQMPGTNVMIIDESGSAAPGAVISVAPTGGDTIQGINAIWPAIASARGFVELETDGSSKWTVSSRSSDEQLFLASGTFSRLVGFTDYDFVGCGQGGGGGGGVVVATGSGGGGGGGGECHEARFKAADLVNAAPFTLTVTITTNTNGGLAGAGGTQGGSTILTGPLGTLETWFGGGGGGVGNASISTGGAGGGIFAAGSNSSTTGPAGCAGAGGGNNGGAPTGTSDGAGCGAGGGGSSAAGVARSGGSTGSATAGPAGSAGGGTSSGTGITAATGSGGRSIGCQTAATGGGLNTNGGTASAPDFNYHPGCGGAGGGGASAGTAGSGSAGTSAGGGGGGGSANTGGTAGSGGNGGAGFLIARGR